MYYPLSQVISNLFTNGNEFVYLSNKTSYSGYYWKTSDGKFFTGKTPQDTPCYEIIQYDVNSNVTENIENDTFSYYNKFNTLTSIYLSLKKPLPPSLPPLYSPNIPSNDDYKNGEFNRYFCKKTNEILYLEINLETYNKLNNKDSTILYPLYYPFKLIWKLTGDKSQVFITNKNSTELVSNQLKLPKFGDYLKNDFIKYYK